MHKAKYVLQIGTDGISGVCVKIILTCGAKALIDGSNNKGATGPDF